MSKAEKIKAEIERLKEETFDNKELTLEEIITARNCYNNLLFFIDSLEQPIKRTPAEIEAAMQEVEEKSKLFTEAHKDDVVSNGPISNPLEISRHGNSHIGETLEEAAENYPSIIRTISPQWESEIEMAFKAGAQWQKQQDQSTIELAEDHAYLAGQEKIINKACEWLEEQLLNFWSQKITNTDYFIEDFKRAMEE